MELSYRGGREQDHDKNKNRWRNWREVRKFSSTFMVFNTSNVFERMQKRNCQSIRRRLVGLYRRPGVAVVMSSGAEAVEASMGLGIFSENWVRLRQQDPPHEACKDVVTERCEKNAFERGGAG